MFLSHVRVLEVANVITGPLAGQILADLGADVIKLEGPPSGDPFRAWEGDSDSVRPSFASYNRGKRSIGVNLRSEGGRAVYGRLLANADVVIENFRPGVMDRLGFAWAEVQKLNPSMIYCHISGMGSTGPDSERPTYDAVAQALSGLWSQLTDLADPQPAGPPIADQLTGMNAAIAILAGLARRHATGEGARVEVDMLSTCLAFQASGIASLTRAGIVPDAMTRAHSSQAYAFVAGDGKSLGIHLSTAQKFFSGLCRAICRPDLVEDERFAHKSARIRNYDVLHDVVADIISRRPRAHWLERFRENDVPCAPILDLKEATSQPQVLHGDVVMTSEETAAGLRGLVRSPFRYGGTYLASDVEPPRYGEQTDEVMAAIGYAPLEIARLRDDHVLK